MRGKWESLLCEPVRLVEHKEEGGGLYVGDQPVRVEATTREGYTLDRSTLEALGFDSDPYDGPTGTCLRLKRCAVCNRRFIGHFSRRLCSTTCQSKAAATRLARHRAKRREPYASAKPREGRDGIELPPLPSGISWRDEELYQECPECERGFDRQRITGRYCSAACRQKAYRKRRVLVSD
jgi:hypothetical protein